MSTNSENEIFIEMTELCQIIKAQDIRTAMKWCRDVEIPVQVLGKRKLAYRFLVEAELDKVIIQKFKKQDPENWEQLYKHYKNNDAFGYLLEVQPKNPFTHDKEKITR